MKYIVASDIRKDYEFIDRGVSYEEWLESIVLEYSPERFEELEYYVQSLESENSQLRNEMYDLECTIDDLSHEVDDLKEMLEE